MHLKNWLRPLLLVGIGAVALMLSVACGGDDEDAPPSMGSMGSTNATVSSSDGGKAQTVKITMKDSFFEQKEITVDKGTVTFEVKNEGTAIHNMHVLSKDAEGNDYLSKHIIEGGKSDKFTAAFTKSGSIKFQCDFHLPDMVGTINVK